MSTLYSALVSFLYGAANCHKGGVSIDALTNNIIRPFFSSGSLMNYLDNAGQAAANRRYDGDLQGTLDVWNDAVRHTITDVDAINIDTSLLEPMKQLLDRSSANWSGNSELAAIVETFYPQKIK